MIKILSPPWLRHLIDAVVPPVSLVPLRRSNADVVDESTKDVERVGLLDDDAGRLLAGGQEAAVVGPQVGADVVLEAVGADGALKILVFRYLLLNLIYDQKYTKLHY